MCHRDGASGCGVVNEDGRGQPREAENEKEALHLGLFSSFSAGFQASTSFGSSLDLSSYTCHDKTALPVYLPPTMRTSSPLHFFFSRCRVENTPTNRCLFADPTYNDLFNSQPILSSQSQSCLFIACFLCLGRCMMSLQIEHVLCRLAGDDVAPFRQQG